MILHCPSPSPVLPHQLPEPPTLFQYFWMGHFSTLCRYTVSLTVIMIRESNYSLTCADGGSEKMAGGLSGDGDGDITDELIPAGKNNYLIDLCTSM